MQRRDEDGQATMLIVGFALVLAMAIAMVVAGQVAGAWTAARGPRAPMVAGCLLAGGGMFLVDSLLSPSVDLWKLSGALAVVGLGLGLALVAVTASVLAIVPAERSGMAASTVNTSRELGGVLAVAILGAVINGRLVSDLTSHLGGLGVSQDLQQLVVHAVTHGGLPARRSCIRASSGRSSMPPRPRSGTPSTSGSPCRR